MTIREDGKRFSRRKRLDPATPDERRSHLAQWRTPTGEDLRRDRMALDDWREIVTVCRESACAYLDSKGLPTAFRVYLQPDGKWAGERPERDQGSRALDAHIEASGYARDSLEDLSARVVCLCGCLESAAGEGDRETMTAAAFELGQVWTLATVYGIEAETKRAAGRKGAAARWSGDAQQKVDAIIHTLAARRDSLGDSMPPGELWGELYSELERAELTPYEYRDPPRIECAGLRDPIGWEGFRRRIQRARNS